MRDTVLEIGNIHRSFKGLHALKGVSFSLLRGEVLGIVGPNGAGKTTLFNVITGYIRPDAGSVLFRGKQLVGRWPYQIARAGVVRSFQDLRIVKQMLAREHLMIATRSHPGERLCTLFFTPKRVRNHEANHEVKTMGLLTQFGLAHKANSLAGDLSYGQQKLLSIACCMATEASLFLLDEPVAGIAPQKVELVLRTIRNLSDQGKSSIIIEHNMDAITEVCDRVVFLDAGSLICEGTPHEIRNDRRVIEAYLG